MHVAQADTQGNTNIGLYAHATDEYCVLGPEGENLKQLIEEVLQVPVIMTTIAGTSLAGVFCTGTSNTVLVPKIAFDHEIEALEKAGLDVHVIDTNHTALGNNIVATDSGALIGPMFGSKEVEQITEALGTPVKQTEIAGVEVVGSSIAVNSTGGVIHPNASNLDIELVKDTLGVDLLLPGTVNFGVPYARSGLIANTSGFLIGKSSGGPEITNADEAFGFIEG